MSGRQDIFIAAMRHVMSFDWNRVVWRPVVDAAEEIPIGIPLAKVLGVADQSYILPPDFIYKLPEIGVRIYIVPIDTR